MPSGRRFGFAAALIVSATPLSGCGKQSADPDALISCRPKGATVFSRACMVEHTDGPAGPILTLRHPDGRFRRLLVVGGRGIVAADDAEPAVARMGRDGEIDVTIAGDSYRLPATITALP